MLSFMIGGIVSNWLKMTLRLALLPVVLGGHLAWAQSTAFTYQGRLTLDGTNITGNYDFTFSLFDSQTNGSQVGETLTNKLTQVSNSRFTVPLDFGYGVFDGSQLWLELGLRSSGSSSNYTRLSPRQALTATPYALFALSADAAGLAGVVPDTSLSSNVVLFNQGGFNAAVTLNNVSNQFTGVFTGDGTALTLAPTNLNVYNSAVNPVFLTMNPVAVLDSNYAAPLYIAQAQVPQAYTTDPHPDTLNKLMAYNETGIGAIVNSNEPAFGISLESDWANYSWLLQSEFYFEYTFPYTNYNIRPFYFNFVRSTNTDPALVAPAIYGGILADSFTLGNFDDSAPTQVRFNMSRGADGGCSMQIAGDIVIATNGGGTGSSALNLNNGNPVNFHNPDETAGACISFNPRAYGYSANALVVSPYVGPSMAFVIGSFSETDWKNAANKITASISSNGVFTSSQPGGFVGSGSALTNLDWNHIANPPAIPSTNGLASLTDVTNIAAAQIQLATAGLANVRNGVVTIADSATLVPVIFSSPLPDTNYSVVATPEFNTGGATWWVDTKTTNGFNFNLTMGVPGGGNVSWEARSSQ
jgi:hypothetical protein